MLHNVVMLTSKERKTIRIDTGLERKGLKGSREEVRVKLGFVTFYLLVNELSQAHCLVMCLPTQNELISKM